MAHISRRDFLKIAGSSAAASAMTCSCASRPSTIVLSPDKVAYVCGCKPDVHNPGGGGNSSLFIGNYCRNSERFLLHWDLSGLSSKRKINRAVMGLYCVEIHGKPSGRLIYAPLKSDWGETVTYNSQPKNEAGRQVGMDWPAKGSWQEVDVTGIVTQWLAAPNNNSGLVGYAVDVKEETCSAVFASIHMPEGIRPKLTLSFGDILRP
jgi:hypothetical protein